MAKRYAVNKRAKYDYEFLETYEAGLVLKGHEVKSVRDGNVSMKGSFITVKGGELFLINCHISKYKHAGNIENYDPTRSRKLLMKRVEINSLIGKLKQKGLTLVPISLYNKNRKIKLEFAVARGKRQVDKRESIKKRDDDRKIQRMMKQRLNS